MPVQIEMVLVSLLIAVTMQSIEAGARPETLIDALNNAQDERDAARAELERIPASRELGQAQIAAMLDYLGDVGRVLDHAKPDKLQELYDALRLEMIYYPHRRTVTATIGPGRDSAGVGGGT